MRWEWRAAVACIALSTAFLIGPVAALADPICPLAAAGSSLKHIVFLQFDNLHLERDVPNVPSDLERMPALFHFLTKHGVLSGNDHTVQISHTANGFLTTQAGLYSDRLGSAVSNSFFRFQPDGSARPSSLFVYWTATVAPGGIPVLIDLQRKNTPAPWPAFTKAGCDVGYAGISGAVLENVPGDLAAVFPKDSPDLKVGPTDKDIAVAKADYLGLSIHCARGSSICTGPGAVDDVLPDQPGGYESYKAVFGSKYLTERLTSSPPLRDLDGNTIADKDNNQGFPGFDQMVPAVSLAYAASMLEAGIPVVNVYASDAHDNHDKKAQSDAPAFPPGTAQDGDQLAAYDTAFAGFFDRLKKDGIDETNTLFVFTTDESDHFVGSLPSPANCDGAAVVCSYSKSGELNVDLRRLLADQRRNLTSFVTHDDSAPAVYVSGNPKQNDPATRTLERDLLRLSVRNPLTGDVGPLAVAAIDQAGMRFLHMGSGDKDRLPTFIIYQDEDFYGGVPPAPNLVPCGSSSAPPCVTENAQFAYNHGDFQRDIRTTWLGLAGPGVKDLGLSGAVWSDHVDARPTILALAGIASDYVNDGRALIEFIRPERLPSVVAANADDLIRLGALYKEIDAPFQNLGLDVLNVSTRVLRGNDEDYKVVESGLVALTRERDDLAGRIRSALDAAVFQNKVDAPEVGALTDEAEHFLIKARGLIR
jgi:hypothetical protein